MIQKVEVIDGPAAQWGEIISVKPAQLDLWREVCVPVLELLNNPTHAHRCKFFKGELVSEDVRLEQRQFGHFCLHNFRRNSGQLGASLMMMNDRLGSLSTYARQVRHCNCQRPARRPRFNPCQRRSVGSAPRYILGAASQRTNDLRRRCIQESMKASYTLSAQAPSLLAK